MVASDAALMTLVRAIVADDAAAASGLLATSGLLASAQAGEGATRAAAPDYYLAEIERYLRTCGQLEPPGLRSQRLTRPCRPGST